MIQNHDPDYEPLHPERLTWSVLLGRWVTFAKSALALPSDDAGRRLRDAVPDIITLQAVWFSLENLDELDADERALGLDKAQVLIEKHTAALEQAWAEEPMPKELLELIHDAKTALQEQRGQEG
ncbi:hypothetical protein [Algisphaera agarilytica]|uniref:Uncharacterized protein n=1 Tax=Algisphaera agarilytica TaxID=1385975 RepID=A0A7X0H787_9BACT|nr:hypothetical protein [Algisphaera agarilytica]MBB6430393.1 hypothetical protein [Algisphaera agarilytica]